MQVQPHSHRLFPLLALYPYLAPVSSSMLCPEPCPLLWPGMPFPSSLSSLMQHDLLSLTQMSRPLRTPGCLSDAQCHSDSSALFHVPRCRWMRAIFARFLVPASLNRICEWAGILGDKGWTWKVLLRFSIFKPVGPARGIKQYLIITQISSSGEVSRVGRGEFVNDAHSVCLMLACSPLAAQLREPVSLSGEASPSRVACSTPSQHPADAWRHPGPGRTQCREPQYFLIPGAAGTLGPHLLFWAGAT